MDGCQTYNIGKALPLEYRQRSSRRQGFFPLFCFVLFYKLRTYFCLNQGIRKYYSISIY